MSASASTPTVNPVLATVGGEAEAVAFTTAGATVLAAIILGGIAAFTADLRLRKQLAGEETRQKAALNADEERLAMTLLHDAQEADAARQNDRSLAHLADLRAVLDEGAAFLDVTENHVMSGESAVRLMDDPQRRKARVAEMMEKLGESERGGTGIVARLRVRLGSKDPIAVAFTSATVAIFQVEDAIEVEPPTDRSRAEAKAAVERFQTQRTAFFEAAAKRVGG
jgi:hypothetical protein